MINPDILSLQSCKNNPLNSNKNEKLETVRKLNFITSIPFQPLPENEYPSQFHCREVQGLPSPGVWKDRGKEVDTILPSSSNLSLPTQFFSSYSYIFIRPGYNIYSSFSCNKETDDNKPRYCLDPYNIVKYTNTQYNYIFLFININHNK